MSIQRRLIRHALFLGMMAVGTGRVVVGLHRRFDLVDAKLAKLDSIESLPKELVEHVKKGNRL